ncbi:NtaA/DmoA family FMN-dependent monooxygenase [Massilia niabensis]|uniref:NtaA/DmoA family FMN-dependent monooxygenase n=1 Tax=Massilia niabensis TaxID=544910 RepID=A0ABW0L0H6_9BURK
MTNSEQMHLTVQLSSGYGVEPGGWRWPGENPSAFVDIETFVKAAQVAERGMVDAFFMVDIPGTANDIARSQPQTSLDPIVVLTSMAMATERLGLVATMSTTFNEPYNIARQFRSLDLVSKGRVGWNVVTTGASAALLNYLPGLPSSEHKHARSREVHEAVVKLWGSWPQDALLLDVEGGRFADTGKIKSIDYRGEFVTTKGPLNLPPSPQGMPVVFTAGGAQDGFQLAAASADATYNNPYDIQSAQRYWSTLKNAMARHGRKPEDITVFSGIITSVASTEREALDRRAALDDLADPDSRVAYLGYMLGIHLDGLDRGKAIPQDLMARARPTPADPRSRRAYELAKRGLTIRDILAHGPINYHPVALGTPEQVADLLEAWFRADIGRGFNITPDSGLTALTDFVDQVIPILQRRGLFRKAYDEPTLRGRLGLPYRNG